MPAELQGVVRSRLGQIPVADATVTVIVGGKPIASARTGADGSYRIADLTAGGVTVAASAGSYVPAAAIVRLPENAVLRQDLTLSGTASLSGIVHVAGQPWADALVALVDSTGAVLHFAPTGPDGGYVFTAVPDGEYTVTAFTPSAADRALRITSGVEYQHDISFGRQNVPTRVARSQDGIVHEAGLK
jgi:hypothetical protein